MRGAIVLVILICCLVFGATLILSPPSGIVMIGQRVRLIGSGETGTVCGKLALYDDVKVRFDSRPFDPVWVRWGEFEVLR